MKSQMERRSAVSLLWNDSDHSHIYTDNPSFCTCFFFLDDCAKSLPLATLNPVFTEKAREFLFGAFHHSPQSPLPFDLLLDSVFSFCWSGLIVPSNWSESHR